MIRASECEKWFAVVLSHRVRPINRRPSVSLSMWGILGVGIILLTSATSDRAQTFDRRCGDRTAKGQFDCTIPQPIVSRPEWVYQNVMFAPGDRVDVHADGCVQTSGAGIGSGATWKRYVNPSGANSDRLYHGLIRIPSAKLAGTDVGNTLTRIKNVIGRRILVTGQGVPESQLVLHVGYEDDDLSDNSYKDHDDGTEDQCKGDHGNDGGPAHITITICRGVPCRADESRFPFDVLSDSTDPNGFLLNPHWSWQDRKKWDVPHTSECHEFSKYDIGRPWFSPNFPDCTDQAGLDDVNTPDGLNWAVCTADKAPDVSLFLGTGVMGSFSGHVNWFPVTVEGRAGPVTHEWKDDDYDFGLFSCDDSITPGCNTHQQSLYTNDNRPFLHVEFDSDETIDHFGSDEWVAFHQAVDAFQDAKGLLVGCSIPAQAGCTPDAIAAAQKVVQDNVPAQYFEGHTIMTGLFGLDGEHELKSELHPLYAMATRRANFENDPSDEVWLMFVRNRGDEGYCSSQVWDGGFEDYTFRLPWRDGMTSVDVNWDKTKFEGTPGTSTVPTVQVVRPLPPIDVTGLTTRTNVVARTPGNAGAFAATGVLERMADPGVFVTFHLGSPTTIPPDGTTLGPPASIPFIDGALHLAWTGPAGGSSHSGSVRPGKAAGNVALEAAERGVLLKDDDAESRLATAVEHLPAEKRMAVQKSRAIATTAMPALHKLGRGGRVGELKAANGIILISPGTRGAVSRAGGKASRKLARDAAQMQAICAASNNAPYGLPAAVCKGQVRDHRTPTVRDHR